MSIGQLVLEKCSKMYNKQKHFSTLFVWNTVALLQVVGGAYNFQYFWFYCVPIVHCTGWPDSIHSIKGKEGPLLAVTLLVGENCAVQCN